MPKEEYDTYHLNKSLAMKLLEQTDATILERLGEQIDLCETIEPKKEDLRVIIERIEDKIDLLVAKINLIFGHCVLIKGEWKEIK